MSDNVVSLAQFSSTRINTNSRIIALSGWRGSGKDTVADYLCDNYGYTRVSFAAALKDMVSEMYSVPRSWMDDREFKEKSLPQYPVIPSDSFSSAIHHMLSSELQSGYWTPRALLILEGSIKRSVSSSYWVRRVIDRIRNSHGKFIITDMRYTSEADQLRLMLPANELLMMRIHRFDSIDTNDPSERDLDNYSRFDIHVSNTVDISTLHNTLGWIVQHIGVSGNG